MSAHFRKPSLGALTTAALALPGLGAAPATAQTGDGWQTDYLYSFYKEGDVPASKKTGAGDSERYEIQTHSLRAVKPIGERSVGVDFLYETLSGASPISVQPNTDGQPVQVMSNPTINEERFDLQLSGSTPLNARLALNMSAGVSDEDDYQARYGTAELSYELAELPMTVTGSLSYSDDELDPTQGTYPTDPAADNKSTLRGTASASYVLNRNTLVQAAAGFLRHSGYLSDPYKQFFVTGSGLSPFDARPDGRRGFHLIGKLRHFVERFNGTVLDEFSGSSCAKTSTTASRRCRPISTPSWSITIRSARSSDTAIWANGLSKQSCHSLATRVKWKHGCRPPPDIPCSLGH